MSSGILATLDRTRLPALAELVVRCNELGAAYARRAAAAPHPTLAEEMAISALEDALKRWHEDNDAA